MTMMEDVRSGKQETVDHVQQWSLEARRAQIVEDNHLSNAQSL